MRDALRNWSRSLVARAQLLLAKRVVWLSDDRRDQIAESSDLPALVGIIGREHYDESRKIYPIRGYLDLNRVLKTESSGGARQLTFIGPLVEDHREVIFFTLKDGFDDKALGALFWIPETFLLSRILSPDSVRTVERAGLCYFIAGSGINMIRGGAVRSPDLFGFAVGLAGEHNFSNWSAEDLRQAFLPALAKVPLTAWLRFANPDVGSAFRKYWRPVAISAAATIGAYFLAVSAYLFVATNARERELANLGDEVSILLEKQRQVGQMSAREEAVVRLIGARQSTYVLWGLAADAISVGGAVSGLYVQNGELVVRGRAKVATDVLARLSARKDVSNARFSSPVRQSGEGEEFSITLKIDSSNRGVDHAK